jgi:nitroreductase
MTDLQEAANELLGTTRSVRRRLDLEKAVPLDLVRECVRIALQAPTGGNAQVAHFLVVTDAGKRAGIADIYRRAWAGYRKAPSSVYNRANDEPPGQRREQLRRVAASADFLVENLHRVPLHVVPCIEGRLGRAPPGPFANIGNASAYGSVLPAAWSFMLAARSRRLGCAWTTAHLAYEQEAAELLGIPYEQVTQVALLPTAYYAGESFRQAQRRPLDETLHIDAW